MTTILTAGVGAQVPLAPITRKIWLQLKAPSLSDARGDLERLRQPLLAEFGHIRIPFSQIVDFPQIARTSGWSITATLGLDDQGWQLLRCEAGDTTNRHFGLAVDVGTTTVVAQLIDLGSGATLAIDADYNGQGMYGDEVMSRIWKQEEPDGSKLLQRAVVSTINILIEHLCKQTGIALEEISAIAVGGNTIMVHFLLGLDASRISQEPYVPVLNHTGFLRAADFDLHIASEGMLYCLPSASGYVGGDVIAGILVSNLHRHKQISLLVDIGTNGEFVMGNDQWLVSCAGAAGPAFEGGVVKAGMRAKNGAVDEVRIDSQRCVHYHVIGEEKAEGLCGSGLVDALAELLLAGIIDRAGQFIGAVKQQVIAPADDSATGRDIVITQADIDSIMLTKAAVNAAVGTLVESVGLDMEQIDTFYAAGAFGKFIDVESAVTIGLYPDLPRERMILLGNSSLEGARQVLLNESRLREAESIVSGITNFKLNSSHTFMSKFVSSSFFPHTNLEYYPSVAAKLAARGLLR
jgi:uncharacterized 2Fe-2S/4Fe-4S cluster protein (DUF4445 family)